MDSNKDGTAKPFDAAHGSAFCREYLGIPHQETADERKLRELAEHYHRCTESYDRTICTGPIQRGRILPANGRELSQINRHAKAVRDELGVEAARLGFTPKQWHEAISNAAHEMPNSMVSTK